MSAPVQLTHLYPSKHSPNDQTTTECTYTLSISLQKDINYISTQAKQHSYKKLQARTLKCRVKKL